MLYKACARGRSAKGKKVKKKKKKTFPVRLSCTRSLTDRGRGRDCVKGFKKWTLATTTNEKTYTKIFENYEKKKIKKKRSLLMNMGRAYFITYSEN